MYITNDLLTYEKKYSCPLNNMGLNCEGPLIRRFFSIVNTAVLRVPWLVESAGKEEPLIQRDDYKLDMNFQQFAKGQHP